MLTLANVFKAQQKYGIATTYSSTESVTYEIYLMGCRSMLTDKPHADFHSWDMKRRNDFTDNLIVAYVKNNPKLVEGFTDENGDIDQNKLISRLRIDIVDFGNHREALEDDTIQ